MATVTRNGNLVRVQPLTLRSDPKPDVKVLTVTPAMAADWLRRNTHNRPLSQSRVEKYAREMKEGRWKMNGEAVSFDQTGTLVQGQHRLHACIASGVPFETLVIFGLAEDVFPTFDQHSKRTLADILAMEGELNAHMLAAALVRMWRYDRGTITAGGNMNYPSAQEALVTLRRHPEIRRSVRYGNALTSLTSGSLMTFLHYVFSLHDYDLACTFMEAVATGANLSTNEPAYLLRARLLGNRMASKAKLPEKEILALTIKAWNLTRAGRRVRVLIWRSAGEAAEEFPEIQ